MQPKIRAPECKFANSKNVITLKQQNINPAKQHQLLNNSSSSDPFSMFQTGVVAP